MQFIPQSIKDVILIEQKIHGDSRGYFSETFRQDLFDSFFANKINFVQDNESKSVKGVLRGFHFQKPPFDQAKLVRCVSGKVLDIAVDLRKESKTFGKYVKIILSENNKCYIIEVNTVPGLTETSLFPKAASYAGLSFDDVIVKVLHLSCK